MFLLLWCIKYVKNLSILFLLATDLLSRVTEEDQKLLKTLLPRVRCLTQRCGQGLSYAVSAKTAISYWLGTHRLFVFVYCKIVFLGFLNFVPLNMRLFPSLCQWWYWCMMPRYYESGGPLWISACDSGFLWMLYRLQIISQLDKIALIDLVTKLVSLFVWWFDLQ